jgi:hypothetical protein
LDQFREWQALVQMGARYGDVRGVMTQRWGGVIPGVSLTAAARMRGFSRQPAVRGTPRPQGKEKGTRRAAGAGPWRQGAFLVDLQVKGSGTVGGESGMETRQLTWKMNFLPLLGRVANL